MFQITNEVLDNGPYVILDVPQKQFAVRQEIQDKIGMPTMLSNEFPVLK